MAVLYSIGYLLCGCSSPKENPATQEDGFGQIFEGEKLDNCEGDFTY